MTERTTPWPAGSPAWADLSVSDIERSKTFYTSVLGWDYTGGGDEFGGYLNATVDGKAVAAMAPPMEGTDEPAHVWTVYLAVEDGADAQQRITEAGGSVLMPPMQVGEFGAMGFYADPTGAAFGTWQAGSHTGFQLVDEPGAVSWTEAMTGDFERGKEFYAAVFGYRYQDMSGEGMKYAIFAGPGQDEGGMAGGFGEVDTAAGEQPYWSVIFAVDDVDDAVRRITGAGGQITTEPLDFDFGRMAVATGPDGESFGVFTEGKTSG